MIDQLKYLPVLINLGRGAITKDQLDLALEEWDKLCEYVESLEA